MSFDNDRMLILEMIDDGKISASEGAVKLDELGNQENSPKIPPSKENRMDILEQISSGAISAEEGTQRLQALGNHANEPVITLDSERNKSTPHIDPEEIARWKRWWVIPLWIGIGITILSGMWMNVAFMASGTGFWFFFSWIPLLLGVSLIFIGNASRNARWLHVRIKEEGHRRAKIAISIPLPIRFSAWVLRSIGKFVPALGDIAIDELILALDKETAGSPFYVKVNEGEDGEKVEVFIG